MYANMLKTLDLAQGNRVLAMKLGGGEHLEDLMLIRDGYLTVTQAELSTLQAATIILQQNVTIVKVQLCANCGRTASRKKTQKAGMQKLQCRYMSIS